MTALLERSTVPECEICAEARITGSRAAWIFTGQDHPARWFCDRHAKVAMENIDPDLDHWRSLDANMEGKA